jgi:raffinose/stachyose/melibiose transport system permease protein
VSLFSYTPKSFAREIGVLLFAVAFCIPAYVLAVLSLKSTPDTYLRPLSLPTSPHLGNYSQAWKSAGLGNAMVSSVIITVSSVAALIVMGSLCAYAIARRPTKLGSALYVFFVLGIILPFQLAIIPTYVVLRKLHLVSTYPGMVLLYTGLLLPLTVFLYTGFIRGLPKEYEEAAQVDGAGLVRTWIRVVMPLLLPVTATVGIVTGLFIWNDFFLPLIFLFGSNRQTLPLALYSFVGENVSQWNLIMAGVAISIAPILGFYLFAQRQMIKGFAGGIRG